MASGEVRGGGGGLSVCKGVQRCQLGLRILNLFFFNTKG